MDSNRKRKGPDMSDDGEKNELPPGVTITADKESMIRSISTRSCLDKDRWQSGQMSSLAKHTKLEHLELDKDRYIHHLHESVTQLSHLQSLLLTRCSRLQSLPNAIGQLENLQVVSMRITFLRGTLPLKYQSIFPSLAAFLSVGSYGL